MRVGPPELGAVHTGAAARRRRRGPRARRSSSSDSSPTIEARRSSARSSRAVASHACRVTTPSPSPTRRAQREVVDGDVAAADDRHGAPRPHRRRAGREGRDPAEQRGADPAQALVVDEPRTPARPGGAGEQRSEGAHADHELVLLARGGPRRSRARCACCRSPARARRSARRRRRSRAPSRRSTVSSPGAVGARQSGSETTSPPRRGHGRERQRRGCERRGCGAGRGNGSIASVESGEPLVGRPGGTPTALQPSDEARRERYAGRSASTGRRWRVRAHTLRVRGRQGRPSRPVRGPRSRRSARRVERRDRWRPSGRA